MFKFLKKYWEEILLTIFILIAGILRFYHITRLEFFTYDQARDALFVKRMIVDHEFRLLGTQTSLPGMYLPPFYYYTIAIVLWLGRLNPVAIDIYSALIGVLSVPLVFSVSNKIFGKPAGIFSAGLFAVSPLVVELTRRAWNPNTLPFFILVTFYFVYQYFKEGKLRDFFLAFGFYGYCLSLHFGAWTLLPLFAFIWFDGVIKKKLSWLGGLGGIGILFFFVSPLLLFELKHNFFLSSQAKMFFFDGGHLGVKSGTNIVESFLVSLISLFTILISGRIFVGYQAPLEFSGKFKDIFLPATPVSVVAQKPFSISFQWWGLMILGLIIYFSLKKFSDHKLSLILIWVWILWGIFVSRLYSGGFFFFYYLYLFPAPILLFSFLFKNIVSDKRVFIKAIGWLSFSYIVIFHLVNTTVFANNWRNIGLLKEAAKVIAENSNDGEAFNIATIQRDVDRWDRNSVDYRYFTESYYHKRALDWYPQEYAKADSLFVVDEAGGDSVLRSNIMEIQQFGPKEILGQWEIEKGIVIYKLGK